MIYRLRANGADSYEPVARLDPATNRFVTIPIDLGPETDLVYLIFRLLRSLIGRGEVDVVLTVDGKTSNTLRVNVK